MLLEKSDSKHNMGKLGLHFVKHCYSYLSNSIYPRDFIFFFHLSTLIVFRKIEYKNSCLDVLCAPMLSQVSFVKDDRLGEKCHQSCHEKTSKLTKNRT